MARTRNIKPGFFTNEELAEIEPLGRLLFAGLWTIADREGRIEDRPKRIKVAILPYDDCDVDALLAELHNRGFITRYKVNGGSYLEITNFAKHQHIVGTEAKSDIPPNPYNDAESEQARNEYEKKSNELEKKSNLFEEIAPESRILNLESIKTYSDSDESLPPPEIENVPYKEIVNHYDRFCPSLPKPKALTSSRKKDIKARWNNELEKNFTNLDDFYKRVESSDFLTGRNGARAKPFGIDWIFKQGNFMKIIEGNYDNPISRDSSSVPVLTPEEQAEKKRQADEARARYEEAELARVRQRYGGGELSESA